MPKDYMSREIDLEGVGIERALVEIDQDMKKVTTVFRNRERVSHSHELIF